VTLPESDGRRPTLAIAGATGFVGRAFCAELAGDHRVIGLTRGAPASAREDGVEWRRCDLFDLDEIERALQGAEVAIYLVHSMLPTARLTQASFADLDLLLADNFARAAERAGVSRILYVGGLVPERGALSPHLASRLEVERTLASRKPALTALRCGIIVGPGSSSLWILVNLVRRLPAMILPRWTESVSQPIALADLVRAVRLCLAEPARFHGTFDLGGPEAMTYGEMLKRTARFLGRRRWMFGVRAFSPRLSRLWVSVFGSAPRSLVAPLVESLRHDMPVRANPLQSRLAPRSFEAALATAIDAGGRPVPPPSSIRLTAPVRAKLRQARSVRSVQRLPLPAGRDAGWLAGEYLRFLPRLTLPRIRVEVRDACATFRMAGTRQPLLELTRSASSESDRTEFRISGGRLLDPDTSQSGRLEFREVLGGDAALAAVHDYQPSLPWLLYQNSQARVHLWVMQRFARHLVEGSS
jgi:uncharacterized protein YbjT (DUF2867 family)